jgi:hypothetical protein
MIGKIASSVDLGSVEKMKIGFRTRRIAEANPTSS